MESGKFELLKNSIGNLTSDRRLQALLIAFAFGAFVEGAAGFGTPVAVAGAMLAGLGFTPFYAAAICLLANTAPVAFGSIAIPITTLAGTTGLPLDRLSAGVGRICAPVSLFVPAYLILVMSGWKGLRSVLPAAALCGVTFAGTQFLISNFVNAQLTDILAALASMLSLLLWIRLRGASTGRSSGDKREVAIAWAPYALLVIFVLLWGFKPIQTQLDSVTHSINWSGLHNTILRMPPVVAKPSPYPAVFKFSWLSASGTACLFAAILGAMLVGLSPARFFKVLGQTARQLALAELTLAAVLALAFLMNYSGATATLGLAFAATGVLFPFFSALLGWLGVFLTGSDTSANALVRYPTGGDGPQARHEPGADGVGQLRRRRDGQNDQPHQHRRGRLRHQHEARGRIPALPLHSEAQRLPGLRHRPDRGVLRLRDARVGSMRLLPFVIALPLLAQQFPAIEGQNLLDQKVKFPDGQAAVVVMGFTHASQNQTKAWAQRIGSQFPLYSIAVLEDVPRLVRGMASHGIKSGTPENQRAHFLLVYHNEKELKQAAGFSTPDDAYVLVLDKSGVIQWKFHGPVTDAAFDQLKAHAQSVPQSPPQPAPAVPEARSLPLATPAPAPRTPPPLRAQIAPAASPTRPHPSTCYQAPPSATC